MIVVAVALATAGVLLTAPTATAVNPGADGDIFFNGGPDGFDDGLWVMTADGSRGRALDTGYNRTNIEASPDGLRVVYEVSDQYEGGIFVINADGSGRRQLTDNHGPRYGPGTGRTPQWSPDGRYLYYVRETSSRETDVMRVKPNGTDRRRLPEGTLFPREFSADGRRLLLVEMVEGADRFDDPEIFSTTLTGGDRRRITTNDLEEQLLSASPDGKRLAFTAPKDGTDQVFVVDVDDDQTRQLTFDPPEYERYRLESQLPRWSPSGTQILWTRVRYDRAPQLWVMNADGSEQRQLALPTGFGELATWASRPGTCRGRPVTVRGTSDDDVLTGTPGNDVIAAGSGDDVVRGHEGADVVCAGDGDDRVSGGSGDDVLDGGRGNDRVWGGAGRDSLKARDGARDPRLSCGAGRDAAPTVDRRDPVTSSCG